MEHIHPYTQVGAAAGIEQPNAFGAHSLLYIAVIKTTLTRVGLCAEGRIADDDRVWRV